MKNEFKEIIAETKRLLKKVENRVEERSEDLTEEVNDLWMDLKKRLSSIEEKLDDAYDHFEDETELKGHLAMMEIRERSEKFKDVMQQFTDKISSNAHEELDVVTLRAHLLKMDSEDLWEKKQKDIELLYEHSKDEAEKLAIKAAKEFNHMFLKLTEIV